MGKNAEEFEKRLAGPILSGRSLICIDNVQAMITTDFICQAVEQPLLSIRMLGRNDKNFEVWNRWTMFANGNNMVIASDLVRRAVRCTLTRTWNVPKIASLMLIQ